MKFFYFLKYILYAITFVLLIINTFLFNNDMILLCLLALFFYLIISFCKYIFGFRISPLLSFVLNVFVFFSIVLGEVCSFYDFLSFYDNILHFFGGFLGGCLGFSILINIVKEISLKKELKLTLMFIFCFSITIGFFWEVFEYTIDKYFDRNMQKDELVTKIKSNYFSENHLILLDLDKVIQTKIYTKDQMITISGGYLDIGLVDTIEDLVFDAVGAFILVFFVYSYFLDIKKYKFVKYLIVIKDDN